MMKNEREIQIRPATEDDFKPVLNLVSEMITELHGAAALHDLLLKVEEELLPVMAEENRRDKVFVALSENSCIGCGRARIFPYHPMLRFGHRAHHGYIELMYVQKEFRKCGLGFAILTELEQWLQKQGVDFVTLHHSEPSSDFYKSAGYSYLNEMYKRLPSLE